MQRLHHSAWTKNWRRSKFSLYRFKNLPLGSYSVTIRSRQIKTKRIMLRLREALAATICTSWETVFTPASAVMESPACWACSVPANYNSRAQIQAWSFSAQTLRVTSSDQSQHHAQIWLKIQQAPSKSASRRSICSRSADAAQLWKICERVQQPARSQEMKVQASLQSGAVSSGERSGKHDG